jgi:hypothetical protein
MCFIGLSALKNLKSWGFSVAGGGTQFATNGVFHNSQVCGTTDGAAAVTSSFSGYAVDPIWAWNITMGEIGLFDHALSSSERDEIFAARGVW